MTDKYVQEGAVLEYTAGADIKSGDLVVMGTIAGVALVDIANGAVGAVQTEGVFQLAKATPGAISQGAKVYWDATNSNVTTTATSNTLIGVAAAAELTASTTVNVKLNVGL